MITVRERVQIQGSNGQWYRPHAGMPAGVTWTGERRVVGFGLHDGSTGFGPVYPDRRTAEQVAEAMNEERASYF